MARTATCEEIPNRTIAKLAEKVSFANDIFQEEGIRLFIENNSKLEPIHTTAD